MQNKIVELNHSLNSIEHVAGLILNSSFKGAAAKNIEWTINLLIEMAQQAEKELTELQKQSEAVNGEDNN